MTRAQLLEVAKPILFNTEMVRAILDGRKSATRRVIKPQPVKNDSQYWYLLKSGHWFLLNGFVGVQRDGTGMYPYGMQEFISKYASYKPNDCLYVREAWNADWCDHVIYKADFGSAKATGYAAEPKWRPSIHMPQEAARLFLRVTSVRVERLQEISPYDAQDEGIRFRPFNGNFPNFKVWLIKDYQNLWDSIIKPADRDYYGWDANPWVWVIKFERVIPDA